MKCDGKFGSVAGNFKFALGFALECDLETTQLNAIYAKASPSCFYSSMVNALDKGEKISRCVFCFVVSCLSSLMHHVSCVLLIGLSSSYQQAQVVICNFKFFLHFTTFAITLHVCTILDHHSLKLLLMLLYSLTLLLVTHKSLVSPYDPISLLLVTCNSLLFLFDSLLPLYHGIFNSKC